MLESLKKTVKSNISSTGAKIVIGALDLARPYPVVQPPRRRRIPILRMTAMAIEIASWNNKVDLDKREKRATKLGRMSK